MEGSGIKSSDSLADSRNVVEIEIMFIKFKAVLMAYVAAKSLRTPIDVFRSVNLISKHVRKCYLARLCAPTLVFALRVSILSAVCYFEGFVEPFLE